ncbi:PREDICTED: cullin-1-like [Erythranthe guttata]|uniref:cullin-1-like n=1 Tax=Erythranthe guttata TaxID=4155 RepID=UPI00064DA052|nr:PREDICTED: cullin-1-like [Erythranthe guttata]|eukprot:XP_012828391.1 PREDICTED: cullin-1-like [Erythranthe guttata]
MAGGAAALKYPMNFEEAWPILEEEAINKFIDKLELEEHLPSHQYINSEEYMRFYTLVYNVCSPNPIGPEVLQLYEQYKRIFEDYVSSKVLPSLWRKSNENLLRELWRRWNHHKYLTKWFSRFFNYLSRYYIPRKKLPSLVETSHSIFYNMVYWEVNVQVSEIIISLIDKERKGEEIDQALVKEVLNIYDEIESGDASKHHAKYIEDAIIEATSKFYSRKAVNWIAMESYDDYMLKVEKCLEEEKSRVSNYLSKYKVLEIVQHELLEVQATKLQEKKASS